MIKKTLIVVAGLALVTGLLFGRKVMPYASTAFEKVRTSVNEQVPVGFQIDAARKQLEKIEPEIKHMLWQIAKEKAEVKKLENQLAQSQAELGRKHDEILTLRDHLESGESVYVAVNGKAYTTERVREDLAHRFDVYRTMEKTIAKTEQILELRLQALATAEQKLDEVYSQRRELEVLVENLDARQRMVDVAKTASKIHIDNSQLSQTREFIDDIAARIDVEEQMMNLVPKYAGEIPMDDLIESDRDILDEVNSYFTQKHEDDTVASK